MIIKKIINTIKDNKFRHKRNENLTNEVIWANVYHDSIRGVDCLNNLSLNIGRWAGNYSFFYILKRILFDFKPDSILELGLGESSKFISILISNNIIECSHLIIEHDKEWIDKFNSQFELSKNSKIKKMKVIDKIVSKENYLGYENIEKINEEFSLYIIDGPFGSKHFSRFDIVRLAESFSSDKEFIIIIDDHNREGEKQTTNELLRVLKKRNIDIAYNNYVGAKSQMVIVTKKFKAAVTL